ncbi:hypothetical protein NA57DRAFT_70919 [Rhizodiscina lignyota]|uniref:Uncharacterized protein n=1 Tax=Rhizodiscina lignyota TaxID=1504668 RepID=A0A9P4MEQ7_9PEZI|nr:hypothetical protein NA57DRAFT_70919 [Rhizodiscina lignyota]
MLHDVSIALTKPPLANDLAYLGEGLANMATTPYTLDKWGDGWIPQESKTIVTSVGGLSFNPSDFLVYNVHYADCPDPWVFCHHKDAGITIDSMASQFGRLPIQMRQWVRHVNVVPGDGGWAFEWNGSLTFIGPIDYMANVIVHETAHSLDLNGAYSDNPLSSSDNWWNNYDQDSNVPDPYATSNAIECVAQATVVAFFNENITGGFESVEPNHDKISHQYTTIIAEALSAGQGNSIFLVGQNVPATHRLPNSDPVPMVDAPAGSLSLVGLGEPPDVTIKGDVTLVDTSHRADPHSGCTLTW